MAVAAAAPLRRISLTKYGKDATAEAEIKAQEFVGDGADDIPQGRKKSIN